MNVSEANRLNSLLEVEELFRTLDYPLNTNLWKNVTASEVSTKIVFYIPLIVISVVGNILVSIVLLKKKSLKSVTNGFILNLVVADLLVTCTSTWVHIVDDLSERWLLGQVFCKLNVFVQVMALVSSSLTMTAIATDRFFGIVTPFMFCTHQKQKSSLAVLLIWIVAITAAIPPSVYTNLRIRKWRNYEEVWCSPVWPEDTALGEGHNSRRVYYTAIAMLLYMLPLVVMSCAYTAIIIKVKRNRASELSSNSQKAKSCSRRKVVLMLIILLLVFTLCWLPFQVSMLYYEYVFHKAPQLPGWWRQFNYFAIYMSHANSAFNPIIFVCFSQKIRRAIHELVCMRRDQTAALSRFGSLRTSTKRTWV